MTVTATVTATVTVTAPKDAVIKRCCIVPEMSEKKNAGIHADVYVMRPIRPSNESVRSNVMVVLSLS